LGEEKPEEELMGNIVDAFILCAAFCNLFFLEVVVILSNILAFSRIKW
jgi:hypothetical protein